MKKLYSGFDLCSPTTSVSMTINGPAPMILALFMNAAIDQQVEKHLRETGGWEAAEQEDRRAISPTDSGRSTAVSCRRETTAWSRVAGRIRRQAGRRGDLRADQAETLATVRGTVQADILKEDQAQNTCIFSTEFAMRMMGDVQQYFIDHNVRNFYSVSISGYHIAEAGANPITPAGLHPGKRFYASSSTTSARGMLIDDFAPNLSFFFSNGMDPEYAVIGRVARRIWARAMRRRTAPDAAARC